jgi:hypothetical protein
VALFWSSPRATLGEPWGNPGGTLGEPWENPGRTWGNFPQIPRSGRCCKSGLIGAELVTLCPVLHFQWEDFSEKEDEHGFYRMLMKLERTL